MISVTTTDVEDDRERPDRRRSGGGWIFHLIAGALVLAGASLYVGVDGYFFIDEAAMYAQLEVMDGGRWALPRPFADDDFGAQHVPMANAYVTEDGFAPFVGHPLHMIMAFALHHVVGDVALRLLSALGVLGAAAGAAALAGRRSPPTAVVAFWLTLLATPLLFHSQLVLAHGPGAALAAALVLAMTSISNVPLRIASVSAITATGVLFRSEFLLFAAAVALVYGAEAIRRRRPVDFATAGFVAVSTVVTYRLEPRLLEALVGGEARSRALPSTSGAREGLVEVLVGARRSLLDIGGSSSDVFSRLTLLVAVVLSLVGVVAMLARVPDRGLVRFASFGALAAAALHLTDAHLVRGALWAVPVLVLLLPVLLQRVPISELETRRLWAVAVFALLVIVTQYSGGGGPEWGWRYSAIAIPVLAPTLARAFVSLWQRAPVVPRGATAALAATFVLVTVSSLVVQERQMSDTAAFLDAAEDATEDFDADFVVFTDPSFGRLAYTVSLDGKVARVDRTNSDRFLRRLAGSGAARVLLVWRGDEPTDLPLGPYERSGERYVIDSKYRAGGLVRR